MKIKLDKDLPIEKRLNAIGITVDHSKKNKMGKPLLMKDGKELGYYDGWEACKEFLINENKK